MAFKAGNLAGRGIEPAFCFPCSGFGGGRGGSPMAIRFSLRLVLRTCHDSITLKSKQVRGLIAECVLKRL